MKAELGHGPWEKDYQPSGISRAEQAYNKMFHNPERMSVRSVVYPTEGTLDYREPFKPFFLDVYQQGYEQAKKDILPAAKALVDAVERYTMGKCLRSELLNKNNELKRLLNDN